MIDKLSEWKIAKELCESINHLEPSEKIKHIQNSNVSQNIKTKALNLIEKFNADYELIESVAINKITITKEENLTGKNIGGYELIEIIGSGGMSTVYKAKRSNQNIQKFVAIKILSSHLSRDKYLELFIREQTTLSQLNHPNIVSMHHGGKNPDGINYLVMDYIDVSSTIITHATDKRLTLRQRIELIITAARAVAHAHKNNIIHRDIKPENIVIDENDVLKIVDFGSAQLTKNIGKISTKVFTPLTASPEQIQGKKVDERTDVFSLGIVLLDIFTQPVSGVDTNNGTNKVNEIETRKQFKAQLSASKLDKDLKNIIKMATHIDVNKRYQEMNIFANDLDNYLQHRPIIASNNSTIYRAKKFIRRHPITNSLLLLLFIASIFTIITIKNNTVELQQAKNKNSRSLALIDALFEQADPLISGKISNEIIKTLESIKAKNIKLIEPDPEFKFHFYNKIAHAYNHNGNMAKAILNRKIALQALSIYKDTNNKQHLDTEIKILHEMSGSGAYLKTISLANALLKRIESQPDIYFDPIMNIYARLNVTYVFLKNYVQAEKISKKAIKMLKIYPNTSLFRQAHLLNSIAIVQKSIGDFESASKNYQQSIKFYKQTTGRKIFLSTAIKNFALLKKMMGDYSESEKLYLEGIDIIKSANSTHVYLASSYLYYSTLLAETNRIDEAIKTALLAADIYNDKDKNNMLSTVYGRLANYSLKLNNLKKAIHYLQLARQAAFATYGLDSSKILHLYELSLWVLMLDPYQHQA